MSGVSGLIKLFREEQPAEVARAAFPRSNGIVGALTALVREGYLTRREEPVYPGATITLYRATPEGLALVESC